MTRRGPVRSRPPRAPVSLAAFRFARRRVAAHPPLGAPELTRAPSSAWYADFFTELPNAFWRAAVPPHLTAAEVDFVAGMAGLRPGARVLDVPCGSGRHALDLARRGY